MILYVYECGGEAKVSSVQMWVVASLNTDVSALPDGDALHTVVRMYVASGFYSYEQGYVAFSPVGATEQICTFKNSP